MFRRRLRSHATGNDAERTAQRLVELLGKRWLGQKVPLAKILDFSSAFTLTLLAKAAQGGLLREIFPVDATCNIYAVT